MKKNMRCRNGKGRYRQESARYISVEELKCTGLLFTQKCPGKWGIFGKYSWFL